MRKRLMLRSNPSRVQSGPSSFWGWKVRDHRDNVHLFGAKNAPHGRRAAEVRKTYRRQWKEIRIGVRRMRLSDWNLLASFALPGLIVYGVVIGLTECALPLGRVLLPRYFDPKSAQARPMSDLYVSISLAILFWLAVAVGAWTFLHWMFRRWTIPQLARIKLLEGLCASCGYPIRKLPAASDGCTVCPECGAAWKLVQTISGTGNRE
ncbi:MAG: hypothetical protein KF691_05355 [Phycisphaeraceae bacterium]|nr:hypothetical protein [Phycisphaeraceae bacterium]